MKNKKYLIGIFVFILCFFLLCVGIKYRVEREISSYDLCITNLNVGKADAAIIQCGDAVGMIDTGIKEKYDVIETFLDDNEIEKLNFLLLTHYDKDHIGCAKKIIKKYEIDVIFLPDYESEKAQYDSLISLCDELTNVHYVGSDETFSYGDLVMEIIPAEKGGEILLCDESSYDNNMSLVSKLRYGDNTFLFTGDIEAVRIDRLIASGVDLKSDWIKMPHHAVYDEEQDKLLDKVSPQYAIISTSNDDIEDRRTIQLLDEYSIRYYITGNGDITTFSNGEKIIIK